MPQTAGNVAGNYAILMARIQKIEARLDAQAALQTYFVNQGNSIYILGGNSATPPTPQLVVCDASGNAVFLLGDISLAPQDVNTTSQTTVSTTLTGRGAASKKTGSWVQI